MGPHGNLAGLLGGVVAAGGRAASVGGTPATAASTATARPAGCNPGWPVVAHRPGAQVGTLPIAQLPIACGAPTGYASSESTIAVAGDGALIYSPAETENSMARSTDAGASWQLTYPAAEQ